MRYRDLIDLALDTNNKVNIIKIFDLIHFINSIVFSLCCFFGYLFKISQIITKHFMKINYSINIIEDYFLYENIAFLTLYFAFLPFIFIIIDYFFFVILIKIYFNIIRLKRNLNNFYKNKDI